MDSILDSIDPPPIRVPAVNAPSLPRRSAEATAGFRNRRNEVQCPTFVATGKRPHCVEGKRLGYGGELIEVPGYKHRPPAGIAARGPHKSAPVSVGFRVSRTSDPKSLV